MIVLDNQKNMWAFGSVAVVKHTQKVKKIYLPSCCVTAVKHTQILKLFD